MDADTVFQFLMIFAQDLTFFAAKKQSLDLFSFEAYS